MTNNVVIHVGGVIDPPMQILTSIVIYTYMDTIIDLFNND